MHGITSVYVLTTAISQDREFEGNSKIRLSSLSEVQIQSFFSFLLADFETSTKLSQAILDWRDADSIPRPSGAERDDYIKAERLALPTNAPFREIEELQDVMGMTPEIYAKAVPYLTTHGVAQVNLNTAPVPVLRALPGMTDATLNMILQLRSQGRRITDVGQIFSNAARGGRPMPGQLNTPAVLSQLQAGEYVDNRGIDDHCARRSAVPTKLTAISGGGNPRSPPGKSRTRAESPAEKEHSTESRSP